MVGKASLLLVMGFSVIFLIFGYNFNGLSNQTVDNFTDYYKETMSHNLASSGANLAANAVFLDNNWTTGYSNLQMNGGVINVSVQIVNAAQNVRKIISTASFDGDINTVEVILSPSRFSQFAYYSESEGGNIWWTGKDTVFGPFHTQDDLRADSHPVFGVVGYRTTIKGSVIYKNKESSDKPVFHGSFQTGVDEPLPTDGLQPLRDAAVDDGYKITQSSTTTVTTEQQWIDTHWEKVNGQWKKIYGHYEDVITTSTSVDTVYITFVQDSVNIKLGYAKPATTYLTSEIAPNGVIYAQGMDVRLKGTVQGQYSVVGDGNIYLDDDIVYKTDPNTNPNTTDLLGIVAQNNVYITDNNATQNIKIDAAIYCDDGGFGAENYDSRSVDGDINLLGGITQHIRRAVGQYTTSYGVVSVTHGYNKRYRYDKRLLQMFPPFFPTTGGFSIVSWKE
jgi:hypothetical protein